MLLSEYNLHLFKFVSSASELHSKLHLNNAYTGSDMQQAQAQTSYHGGREASNRVLRNIFL